MPTYGSGDSTITTKAPRDVYQVIDPKDLDSIDVGNNIRHAIPETGPNSIEEMIQMLADNPIGQQSPAILVKKPDGGLRLLGGRRRLEAIKRIRDNFDELSVIHGFTAPLGLRYVIYDAPQSEWLKVMVQDNAHNPLSYADQVEVVRQARKSDMSDAEIAKLLRVSEGWITHTLSKLLSASPAILDRLHDGRMTMKAAQASLTLTDEEIETLFREHAEEETAEVARMLAEATAELPVDDSMNKSADVEEGDDISRGDGADHAPGGDSAPADAPKRPRGRPKSDNLKPKPAPKTTKKPGKGNAPASVRKLAAKITAAAAAKGAGKGLAVPPVKMKELLDLCQLLMSPHKHPETGEEHDSVPLAYYLYCALTREPGSSGHVNTVADVIYQWDEMSKSKWPDEDEDESGSDIDDDGEGEYVLDENGEPVPA